MPAWRTNAGEVKSDHGLLTVALPEGTRTLLLRFAPRSASGGAMASLVALAAAIAIGLKARRAPIVRGPREALWLAVLVAAPLVPVIATAAIVHEAAVVQPPVTLDGRPVIADDIDEGAVRIDSKLAGDVTLEAATLSDPEPSAASDVTLELDWRRGTTVPEGVGVFVHVEPPSGTTINADHVLLSSVLDFEDAPPGKTLRDVVPLYFPEDARGKTFKVWVGLWRVRREGARIRVVDSGHAIGEGDRILVAQFVVK